MRERDDAAAGSSSERILSSCASITEVWPTSWTTSVPFSSSRASSAPAIVALGAKSPPIASNAMRANLRFLRLYSLLACVIPAFLADMVWALHRLTARTLLNHDRGGDFVGVAGAFLPLRGASFWDGHLSCSLGC